MTCGIGINDIFYSGPGKLFGDLRALLAAYPTAPSCSTCRCRRVRRPAGRRPYLARINRTLHEVAGSRGLPVAEVSAHFLPPWTGKFASDCFHPSQDGYRDWTRALLAVV